MTSKLKSKDNIKKNEYYTVWSGSFIIACLFVLLFYIFLVTREDVGFTALLIQKLIKGILIFGAVNSIAVLVTSFHFDSFSFENRFIENYDNDTTTITVKEMKKIFRLHFYAHILPVMIALLIIFSLKFLSKYETIKYEGIAGIASIITAFIFIMSYLMKPTQDGLVFLNKLNEVYNSPKKSSFIIFLLIVGLGCLSGNLF